MKDQRARGNVSILWKQVVVEDGQVAHSAPELTTEPFARFKRS